MNISQILFLLNASIMLLVSLIHFYWALGGRWGAAAVIPQINPEKRVFMPSPLATVIVAIPFLLISLIFAQAAGLFHFQLVTIYQSELLLFLVAVFAIRALGDFKYVGFFKKILNTQFARNDTKYFTPLCAFIALSVLLAVYFS